MSRDCYCNGRWSGWKYHTPTGCATSLKGLKHAQEQYEALAGSPDSPIGGLVP